MEGALEGFELVGYGWGRGISAFEGRWQLHRSDQGQVANREE